MEYDWQKKEQDKAVKSLRQKDNSWLRKTMLCYRGGLGSASKGAEML